VVSVNVIRAQIAGATDCSVYPKSLKISGLLEVGEIEMRYLIKMAGPVNLRIEGRLLGAEKTKHH
jgi:hypothetical protein